MVRKNAKYSVLGRHFIFQPIAVETNSCLDQRESDFLLQRVPLAIIRGNAFSISSRAIESECDNFFKANVSEYGSGTEDDHTVLDDYEIIIS